MKKFKMAKKGILIFFLYICRSSEIDNIMGVDGANKVH